MCAAITRPCRRRLAGMVLPGLCDRRRLVPVLWRLTVFIVLAAVFPAAYEMHRNEYERHVIAWFIGGVFAGLAVLLSVHQILQHLIYYRQPSLQKHVVRILAMVPIYATNAWFGLRYKSITLYLDVGRDCYEAFVIYRCELRATPAAACHCPAVFGPYILSSFLLRPR